MTSNSKTVRNAIQIKNELQDSVGCLPTLCMRYYLGETGAGKIKMEASRVELNVAIRVRKSYC